MVVKHAEEWSCLERDDDEEHCDAGDRSPDDCSWQGGLALAPPQPDRDRREYDEKVCELETESETEGNLPRRNQPPRENETTASQAIPAHEEEQGKGDATAGDDREMPVLGQPPRRVGECDAADDGSMPTGSKLERKQIRPDEGKRIREDEEDVLYDERRVRTVRGREARGAAL